MRYQLTKPMPGLIAAVFLANLSLAGCDTKDHGVNIDDQSTRLMRLYTDGRASPTARSVGTHDHTKCAGTMDCAPGHVTHRDSESEYLTSSLAWALREI